MEIEPMLATVPNCEHGLDGLTFTFQSPLRVKIAISADTVVSGDTVSHYPLQEREVNIVGLTGACAACRQEYNDVLMEQSERAVSMGYTIDDEESDD